MFTLGLTGGIASGKSTVSKMLRQLGASIIDADLVARQIVSPGQRGLVAIQAAFGADLVNNHGELDRKKLASIVFGHPDKLEMLNRITHPLIKEEIEKRLIGLGQLECPVAVVDAALLIEAGWQNMVDEVWLVSVDEQTQVERLMQRDGLTLEEARCRIRSQMPLTQKTPYANRIIDNSGSAEDTQQQVESFYSSLHK